MSEISSDVNYGSEEDYSADNKVPVAKGEIAKMMEKVDDSFDPKDLESSEEEIKPDIQAQMAKRREEVMQKFTKPKEKSPSSERDLMFSQTEQDIPEIVEEIDVDKRDKRDLLKK